MTSAALAVMVALSTGSVGGLETRWDAAVRTRASSLVLESAGTSDDVSQAGLDLSLRATLGTRLTKLMLTYEPSVAAYAPVNDATTIFRQRAIADLTWEPAPLWKVTSQTSGLYGDIRLIPFAGTASGTADVATDAGSESIDRVPSADLAKRTSISQAFGAEHELTRRLRARAELEYEFDKADARDGTATLPEQHVFRAAASSDWNATRVDVLGLRLEATASDTEDIGQALISRAVGTLRHEHGRTLASSAELGGSVTYDDGNATPGVVAGVGVTEAALFGTRANVTSALRFDTTVDRLTGDAARRLEASGTVMLPFALVWRADARLRGAAVLSGRADGTQLAAAEARISRTLGRVAEIAASYGHFVQTADTEPAVVRQHAVDVSFTMRLR